LLHEKYLLGLQSGSSCRTPAKSEALSSNPSNTKKKKKKELVLNLFNFLLEFKIGETRREASSISCVLKSRCPPNSQVELPRVTMGFEPAT
jgi:hypothetical protein